MLLILCCIAFLEELFGLYLLYISFKNQKLICIIINIGINFFVYLLF